MVSGFWFGVLCVFCLVGVPTVWGEYCNAYWDINNEFHDTQTCSKYCCGNCDSRYCCSKKSERITLDQQEQCHQSPPPDNSIKTGMIVGIVAGAIVFITICVILICCISPGCLIYKQRRNKLSQRQTTNTSENPHPQPGHEPTHVGYRSVPGYDEVPPTPSAPPPSYSECTAPGYPGTEGHPMHPLQPPSQPTGPTAPTHSDEVLHPPNPSEEVDP